MIGCLIILAAVLAFNRIERLEELLHKQQETIEQQQTAIMMQQMENKLLKSIMYPRNWNKKKKHQTYIE